MHLRRAVNTLRHTQRLTNASHAYRQSRTSASAPASFNEDDPNYHVNNGSHSAIPPLDPSREQSPLLYQNPLLMEYKTLSPTVTPKATTRTSTTSNNKTIIEIIKHVLFSSYINIFLLLIPLALVMMFGHWNGTFVFIINFLVLLPLANILGEATESLAQHTGETIGGLINATFGNAVEVVIAIFALSKGQISVVQSSLIGSVLSNLLLVLGCCFLAAGLKRRESLFNATGASANTSLLMLSTFAMLLPTYAVYSHSGANPKDHNDLIISLSRIAGVVLLLMYFQLLIFQLKTHLFLFTSEEEDEEEPDLTFAASFITLLFATLLVSFFSNNLVSSIDEFTETLHISKAFVGVILLPVIGNAVEHITAIKVAMHDKMELAMGVAVGSATQVSLFVVPVTVIAGWILNQPMTLAFPIFESIVYLMSVLIVVGIVSDGKSNWLEGSLLLTTYFMVACALYWINVDG